MKRWMTLAALALVCGTPSVGAPEVGPGDHEFTLRVDGRQRSYLVHVPSSYDGSRPFPLVLSYHGGGANARVQARFSGLNEKADRAGFIVVHPNGTGRRQSLLTWNAGTCCLYAMLQKVDDVGFTRALLDDVAKRLRIDPKRVYATGISNGGMMAYRLACELSDRIAAIAPISGTLGVSDCSQRRPVPVMHFHGTADQFVNYEGGFGRRSRTKVLFDSVKHTVSTWVALNGCPPSPLRRQEPDTAQDGTRVVRETYGPCREGSEVVLFTIEGGGHTWPGREPRLPFLGESTRDVSANDLMWEFFRAHPMP